MSIRPSDPIRYEVRYAAGQRHEVVVSRPRRGDPAFRVWCRKEAKCGGALVESFIVSRPVGGAKRKRLAARTAATRVRFTSVRAAQSEQQHQTGGETTWRSHLACRRFVGLVLSSP